MQRSQLFDITVQLLFETDKAWHLDDGDQKFWFPKSQGELEKNTDGTYELTAPTWLLKSKGLL